MIQPPIYFDPPQMIREVVLVGCGGTGGQIARSLSRIVYDLKRRHQHVPTLKFVDPDRVEAKNVGRQLFTQADADAQAFKAECLSRRFNYALGLDIACYNEPFCAEKHASSHSLVCGAVDNHLARRELARVNGLLLDCGNHVDSGQSVLGNTADLDLVKRGLQGSKTHYLPTFALLFPALLEPDSLPTPSPTASCGDLVDAGDQALLVNDLVAIMAAHYLYKLLNQEPISTFLSFCDAASLNVKSIPISVDNLNAYLP